MRKIAFARFKKINYHGDNEKRFQIDRCQHAWVFTQFILAETSLPALENSLSEGADITDTVAPYI